MTADNTQIPVLSTVPFIETVPFDVGQSLGERYYVTFTLCRIVVLSSISL